MAEILKGKPVADSIYQEIDESVVKLSSLGIVPRLAIIGTSGDAGCDYYRQALSKKCEEHGIEVSDVVLDEPCHEESLIDAIDECNEDSTVHGILLLKPLPKCLDSEKITNCISPKKDIDCATTANLAKLFVGGNYTFAPSTASSLLKMLDYYKIGVASKNVVIVGRSLVVGKPLSAMLTNLNATVTLAHSKTENLQEVCKNAEIVVFAAGKAGAFGKDYFSEGQVVIDVGTNTDKQGNLVGDVDFEAAESVVKSITPVPGGVGSVTTSVTLQSVVRAALQKGNDGK